MLIVANHFGVRVCELSVNERVREKAIGRKANKNVSWDTKVKREKKIFIINKNDERLLIFNHYATTTTT